MKITTKQELIEHYVLDLLDAENQLTKAIPNMVEAATSAELKNVLNLHLEETKAQAERLQSVAELLNITIDGDKCIGMGGIINEGEKTVSQVEKGNVLDAIIIGSAQKIENYEIAAYATLITLLDFAGEAEASEILSESLEEEEEADRKLSDIAMDHINPKVIQNEL